MICKLLIPWGLFCETFLRYRRFTYQNQLNQKDCLITPYDKFNKHIDLNILTGEHYCSVMFFNKKKNHNNNNTTVQNERFQRCVHNKPVSLNDDDDDDDGTVFGLE